MHTAGSPCAPFVTGEASPVPSATPRRSASQARRSVGWEEKVHPLLNLRNASCEHAAFLFHLQLLIVTCMHSHPHKLCPLVEKNSFKCFSLLLRKPVGNNSISFAFSVDSKRTDKHLKLNAVSVGLFITSIAYCQKLVLVVGKLVAGL